MASSLSIQKSMLHERAHRLSPLRGEKTRRNHGPNLAGAEVLGGAGKPPEESQEVNCGGRRTSPKSENVRSWLWGIWVHRGGARQEMQLSC